MRPERDPDQRDRGRGNPAPGGGFLTLDHLGAAWQEADRHTSPREKRPEANGGYTLGATVTTRRSPSPAASQGCSAPAGRRSSVRTARLSGILLICLRYMDPFAPLSPSSPDRKKISSMPAAYLSARVAPALELFVRSSPDSSANRKGRPRPT